MKAPERLMLDGFIESVISWDFNKKFGCKATVWNYLIKKLTSNKNPNPEHQLNP